MRILQVRFKNLNSLVGEWQIDLMHPAFASDGIFAITGPTGAGKTTILDAICLAPLRADASPEQGHQERKRNHVPPDWRVLCRGDLRNPVWALPLSLEPTPGTQEAGWANSRPRSTKLPMPIPARFSNPRSEVLPTRSSRLPAWTLIVSPDPCCWPRAAFAAFLQAAPDDRAPILEQITGTEIYSQISIRVHERQREELDKLNLLQAETAGIVILEPEQEQEIGQALETKQKEETDLAAKSAETGKAIAWLTTIDGLKKEIVNLADEASKLLGRYRGVQTGS